MMASATQLSFISHIGQQKPKTILTREEECPFCDRTKLKGILAEDGPIILVKNKYPTLADSFQTVLIENTECEIEFSLYPKEHLYRVINFGVKKWVEMEESGEFASVLFFKNHGPHSGGTIRHPHMQIVGLKHVDYRSNLKKEHFQGPLIQRRPGVEFNVSAEPRIGFFEFNIILTAPENLSIMADYLQTAAHYILNHFNKFCNSYNFFFYRLPQEPKTILAKAIPRFTTSPLYVGYSIPQVSDRIAEVANEIRRLYFS